MKDSDKRIAFIAEYISAYEEKIRLLNSNGLFDAAKLFELFAIEVVAGYKGILNKKHFFAVFDIISYPLHRYSECGGDRINDICCIFDIFIIFVCGDIELIGKSLHSILVIGNDNV